MGGSGAGRLLWATGWMADAASHGKGDGLLQIRGNGGAVLLVGGG